jgi:hypothetical protein
MSVNMLSHFGITNNNVAAKTTPPPTPQLTPSTTTSPTPSTTEPVVDLGFIRDLQAAYAQKMIQQLTDNTKRIDAQMKPVEFKCAKLMTLLKPSKFFFVNTTL